MLFCLTRFPPVVVGPLCGLRNSASAVASSSSRDHYRIGCRQIPASLEKASVGRNAQSVNADFAAGEAPPASGIDRGFCAPQMIYQFAGNGGQRFVVANANIQWAVCPTNAQT